MLRNQREERLKFVRRESERCDQLWSDARQTYLVELEKPQFAGWEIHVELSESGKRRRDAPDIQFLLDLFKLSKPRFVRNLTVARIIRGGRYSYNRVQVSKKTYISKYGLSDFYDWHTINERTYNGLPPQHKKHFFYDKYHIGSFWNPGNYYRIRWHAVPHGELVFKLKKAYWTHHEIHDGEAQSDYRRLHSKLWRGSLSNDLHRAVDYEGRWRDSHKISIKRAWKAACGKFVQMSNCDCEWDWEEEECIIRHCGCYEHKEFGWD